MDGNISPWSGTTGTRTGALVQVLHRQFDVSPLVSSAAIILAVPR